MLGTTSPYAVPSLRSRPIGSTPGAVRLHAYSRPGRTFLPAKALCPDECPSVIDGRPIGVAKPSGYHPYAITPSAAKVQCWNRDRRFGGRELGTRDRTIGVGALRGGGAARASMGERRCGAPGRVGAPRF